MDKAKRAPALRGVKVVRTGDGAIVRRALGVLWNVTANSVTVKVARRVDDGEESVAWAESDSSPYAYCQHVGRSPVEAVVGLARRAVRDLTNDTAKRVRAVAALHPRAGDAYAIQGLLDGAWRELRQAVRT